MSFKRNIEQFGFGDDELPPFYIINMGSNSIGVNHGYVMDVINQIRRIPVIENSILRDIWKNPESPTLSVSSKTNYIYVKLTHLDITKRTMFFSPILDAEITSSSSKKENTNTKTYILIGVVSIKREGMFIKQEHYGNINIAIMTPEAYENYFSSMNTEIVKDFTLTKDGNNHIKASVNYREIEFTQTMPFNKLQDINTRTEIFKVRINNPGDYYGNIKAKQV